MVVDELDSLRDTNDGCETLAFADLSTRMILVTDTGSSLKREALDALCAEAAMMLGTDSIVALGERPSKTALLASMASVRVFLRASEEPNDVLCCVCAPNVDVDTFVAQASECLNRISNGNG
jgi:hypothetical protein